MQRGVDKKAYIFLPTQSLIYVNSKDFHGT